MPLKVYNTLKKDHELFEPINPPKVNMYVCGVTPYDETHLGHGRAYVVFDIVRRYLEYSGFKVNYIQNITDIDDKIIKRANELKIPIQELTNKYINSYFEVMDKLNIKKASSYPKATEHIKEMIGVIEGLIKKGYAYVVDGPASAKASAGKDVYFEVAKDKDYGKLSKRKLEDLKEGARVAVDERKKAPLDFALWKSAKENEPSWDSPWGAGRPGWHIECSTMSTKYLGETFDIHGGGLDLIFPHHENEIAQAECFTGKPFARYWIHNGFVTVNHEKMSKSLGNFFTLRDIFAKYDPMLIRFYLLSTHYRSPINFSDADLDNAKGGLNRLIQAFGVIHDKVIGVRRLDFQIRDTSLLAIKNEFIKAMDNDFNTAEAIGIVFNLCDLVFKYEKDAQSPHSLWFQIDSLMYDMCNKILGLNIEIESEGEDMAQISILAKDLLDFRKIKDYKKADEIRQKIIDMGWKIELSTNEVRFKKGMFFGYVRQ
jgi:cysteinyl-tRNA synthetase